MNFHIMKLNGDYYLYTDNTNSGLIDYIPVEYKDNLVEILKQENLIEIIENMINDIYKTNDFEQDFSKFANNILTFIVIAIITSSAISLDKKNFKDWIFPFIVSCVALAKYSPIPKLVDKAKLGYENQIYKLENIIDIESKKLEELKLSSKSIDNKDDDNISFIYLKNDEKIEEINKLKKIWYDVGYNKDKYNKYISKGILSEKLKDKYSEEQIFEIEENISELNHGKQYTKKRK